MFTIIGGDGKEYGPATADQIRAWIAGGRANLDTKARAVGSDEWRRLADYPEFNGEVELPPPVPMAPTEVHPVTALARRGSRLGAWLLDNVFVFVCCLPGIVVLGLSFLVDLIVGRGEVGEFDSTRTMAGAFLLGMGGLAALIVQVWGLTTRGQTVGKRILGIRIVRVVDDQNPGFVMAVLLRLIVPGLIGMVPWLGMGFTLADLCFIFRADKRCIHDLIAGTKVVADQPRP